MTRTGLPYLPEYFDRYINRCDDVSIAEAIRSSIEELDAAPLHVWRGLGDRAYAPGKWTIRDILQHLIDTERVFSYRALAFARGDAQLLPMLDEDAYAAEAAANRRPMQELVDELKLLHQSALQLFQSFSPRMLLRSGMGFQGAYSVGSIGFILPGHQRWHFRIIEERYLPLLEDGAASV